MLHIILLILKIIGIILLCLLGLLLLGLCLILFVPVFFEAEVRDEDAFSARGAISWLGIGLRGKFSYEEELQFSLRIFGIRIFPSKENKESSKEKKKTAVTETEPEGREKPPSAGDTSGTDQEGKAEQKKKAEAAGKEEKGSQGKEEDSEEKGKKKRLQKRISLRKKKGKEKRKKKKEGASFFSQIKGILQDDSCREGIIKMMSYMLSFFQSFHMKEAEGEAYFSWGEPDLTGKTLGLISMFPFVYGEKLEINPDFLSEDAYFRGWLKIGGSFQLIYLLILIIRMVKDKEVRKVIFSLIGKA